MDIYMSVEERISRIESTQEMMSRNYSKLVEAIQRISIVEERQSSIAKDILRNDSEFREVRKSIFKIKESIESLKISSASAAVKISTSERVVWLLIVAAIGAQGFFK